MTPDQLTQLFTVRTNLYNSIRTFLKARDYVEVETPILVSSPDLSPNLTPFETERRTENGERKKGALITSPEFSMKKLLGLGLSKIFTITKVFRNDEPDSPTHHPEFTLLEWYRQGMDYQAGMDETEELIRFVTAPFYFLLSTFYRLRLPTLFRDQTGLDFADASYDDLKTLCLRLDLKTNESDSWSDLFHRIYVTKIEPTLPAICFVYDFPKQQAALSRLTPDGRYAERFELYLNGVELCNAFTELTDPVEQRRRFEEEITERKRLGKKIFPIDEELLRLLPSLRQPTFGNALGLDRLLMIILDKKSLDDILPFRAPPFHHSIT